MNKDIPQQISGATTHHEWAAKFHTDAAKAHTDAAKYAKADEYEAAAMCSRSAQSHGFEALHHSQEAAKEHRLVEVRLQQA